jgi:hypothetical protein
MIFLQAGSPPDTSFYFILGYTVIFTVLALYLASLVLRFRNARRDAYMLKELEEKEK